MSTLWHDNASKERERTDLRLGSVALGHRSIGPSDGMFVGSPHLVVMTIERSDCRVDWGAAEGDRFRSSIVRAGQAIVISGRLPLWIKCHGRISAFAFCLDETFVTRIYKRAFGGDGAWIVENLVGLEDRVIERLCVLGRDEFDNGGAGGQLYAEALGTALALHLLRKHGSTRPEEGPQREGLTPAQLRRVTEYMNAHLTRNASLSELAGVAGLSANHFLTCFKLATGVAPHRYLISKRIELARELLRNPGLSIGEIAAAVGFANQSHFTAHFRRILGLTPAQFRRAGR
jgi:AraC family transcriptional regulator